MKSVLLKAALTSLLLPALSVQLLTAEPLYKVVDEEGRVTYTDKPPEESDKAEVTEIPVNPNQNLIKSPSGKSAEQPNKELNQRVAEEKDKDQLAREEYEAKLTEAQKALKDAEQALEDGQAAQKGDWLGKKFGGTRPSPQRLERIERLENDIAKAKKHLQSVKKSRPRI